MPCACCSASPESRRTLGRPSRESRLLLFEEREGTLVASRAKVRADRLLARDRGFFRRRFDGLTVIDPSRP